MDSCRPGARVAHDVDGANQRARAFRNAVHFGLFSGQRRNLLRRTLRHDAVATELLSAPIRATSCSVAPGVVRDRDCSYNTLLRLTLAPQPHPRRPAQVPRQAPELTKCSDCWGANQSTHFFRGVLGARSVLRREVRLRRRFTEPTRCRRAKLLAVLSSALYRGRPASRPSYPPPGQARGLPNVSPVRFVAYPIRTPLGDPAEDPRGLGVWLLRAMARSDPHFQPRTQRPLKPVQAHAALLRAQRGNRAP